MKALTAKLAQKLGGPQSRLGRWLDIAFFMLAAAAYFLMAALCQRQLSIDGEVTARFFEEGDRLYRFVAREWWLFPVAGLSVLVIAFQSYKNQYQPMILSLSLVVFVGISAVLSGLLVFGLGAELKRLGAW